MWRISLLDNELTSRRIARALIALECKLDEIGAGIEWNCQRDALVAIEIADGLFASECFNR